MGASPHVCKQAHSCWLLKFLYMFFVSHFVCGTYAFHLPSSGTILNKKLFNRFIVKWGAVLSLLVMWSAWLIELFLVNIIFINILCTEEQRLFFLAFVTAILNSLSIGSIVWSSGGSYCNLCFAQECSINSPDYGPLPQNAPGWCLAPFDPEGILRFDNGIPFFLFPLYIFY